MKTPTTSIAQMKKSLLRIITILVTKPTLSCILVMLAVNAQAQMYYMKPSKSVGAAVYGQLSANGYGGTWIPSLYFKKERRTYFIGLISQKKCTKVSGVQFAYNYSVTGKTVGDDEGTPELYFFMNAAYNFNASLGKKTLWEEYMADKYAAENHVDALRFQSAEVFAGAGLRIKFLKAFTWDNSVGLGAYYSFDFPDALKLYYQKSNIGIQLRTGITCTIH